MKVISLALVLLGTLSSAMLVAKHDRDHDHEDDQCPRKRHGCLREDDVDYILSVWPRIFDTEDATWLSNNIACIVTEDFVSNNEGSMFFGIMDNGINIHNRSELLSENLGNIQYEAGYPSTRGKITVVTSFYGCDNIALRWMYNGIATGNTKCTSTSNTVKHALEYKGIDMLTIHHGTLQVEKVITSADGVIYSLGVGADFTGSPICPGTIVPPSDMTCPPIGYGGAFPPIEPHAACAP